MRDVYLAARQEALVHWRWLGKCEWNTQYDTGDQETRVSFLTDDYDGRSKLAPSHCMLAEGDRERHVGAKLCGRHECNFPLDVCAHPSLRQQDDSKRQPRTAQLPTRRAAAAYNQCACAITGGCRSASRTLAHAHRRSRRACVGHARPAWATSFHPSRCRSQTISSHLLCLLAASQASPHSFSPLLPSFQSSVGLRLPRSCLSAARAVQACCSDGPDSSTTRHLPATLAASSAAPLCQRIHLPPSRRLHVLAFERRLVYTGIRRSPLTLVIIPFFDCSRAGR